MMGCVRGVQTAGTAKGTGKPSPGAVHSKWLPPLSLCSHFRKDFSLKSGLYPLLCCECRIIYKVPKHSLRVGSPLSRARAVNGKAIRWHGEKSARFRPRGFAARLCSNMSLLAGYRNIDSRFHCSKQSNICLKKNIRARGFYLRKKFLHKNERKKHSYKLKIPHPSHHFSNGPSRSVRCAKE